MEQPTLFADDEPAVEDAQPQVAKRKGKEPVPPSWSTRPGIAEPVTLGATWPERWAVQDTIAADLAGYDCGTTTAEELFRILRGSLYVFTADELVRVGKHLLEILEETDERDTPNDIL